MVGFSPTLTTLGPLFQKTKATVSILVLLMWNLRLEKVPFLFECGILSSAAFVHNFSASQMRFRLPSSFGLAPQCLAVPYSERREKNAP